MIKSKTTTLNSRNQKKPSSSFSRIPSFLHNPESKYFLTCELLGAFTIISQFATHPQWQHNLTYYAKRAGKSIQTFRKYIRQLIQVGLIEKVPLKEHNHFKYRVLSYDELCTLGEQIESSEISKTDKLPDIKSVGRNLTDENFVGENLTHEKKAYDEIRRTNFVADIKNKKINTKKETKKEINKERNLIKFSLSSLDSGRACARERENFEEKKMQHHQVANSITNSEKEMHSHSTTNSITNSEGELFNENKLELRTQEEDTNPLQESSKSRKRIQDEIETNSKMNSDQEETNSNQNTTNSIKSNEIKKPILLTEQQQKPVSSMGSGLLQTSSGLSHHKPVLSCRHIEKEKEGEKEGKLEAKKEEMMKYTSDGGKTKKRAKITANWIPLGPWLVNEKIDNEFIGWIAGKWKTLYGGDFNANKAKAIAHLKKDPNNFVIQWDYYQAEYLDRLENTRIRRINGVEIKAEEQQKIAQNRRAILPSEDTFVQPSKRQSEGLKPIDFSALSSENPPLIKEELKGDGRINDDSDWDEMIESLPEPTLQEKKELASMDVIEGHIIDKEDFLNEDEFGNRIHSKDYTGCADEQAPVNPKALALLSAFAKSLGSRNR